ncbi:hypothetical protein WH47_09664 [Habropoda laboriosa]|uniref:Uncharacterized protein n=1 Tax=Habropoda laboriosa TaxID=597456 RepID=A0A0L7QJ42_9HYME|nr:hypothetical protein WH47_09664 [Habropoda laboriosa]
MKDGRPKADTSIVTNPHQDHRDPPIKKRKKRRGCRAGKSFKAWKKRATEQRLHLVPYIQPPEVIDLTLSDDEETVILSPSNIEVLDTSRAIQVFNHEEIPDESGAISVSKINKLFDKMTTRSKTEAAAMQQALAEEDLLSMQRQIEIREKRVREEARIVEQRRRELENDNQNHKQLRAEIEQLRTEISEQRRSSSRSTLPLPSEPRESEYARSNLSDEPVSYIIREAVTSIPVFDGSNITVLQFSRACKRALDIVPPHLGRSFAKLAITRLRGRAYTAVEDEACETITDLCNRLKDVFGPHHSVDHYRGTLVNTYMRQGEHILDYISRIKDLREAIVDCNRQGADLVEIDSLTVSSFINGLTPDIRPELRAMRTAALNAVFDEAVQVFKQLEVDKTRYAKPQTEQRKVHFHEENRAATTTRVSYQPPQRSSSPYRRTEPSPVPWRQMPQRRDSSPVPPSRYIREAPRTTEPPRRFTAPARICNYCRTPGHDIHECRKRMFNNAQQSGNEPLLSEKQGPKREEVPRRVQAVNQEGESEASQSPI